MIITGNKLLKDVFRYNAENFPEKTCIMFGDLNLSYSNFYKKINQVSNYLLSLGIEPQERIILHLDNCPEFLFAAFGIINSGAVLVMSNVLHKKAELQYILEHSEASVVITEPKYVPVFNELNKDRASLNIMVVCEENNKGSFGEDGLVKFNQELLKASCDEPQVTLEPGDWAAMLYTSGTTSRPKGVMYSQQNLVWAGEIDSKHQGLLSNDLYLCFFPLYHMLAFNCITIPTFYVGGTLILLKGFSASRWWEQIKQYKPTITFITGPLLRILINAPENPDEKSNSIKICGYGLPLSEDEFAAIEKRFGFRLFQVYGMTEAITGVLSTPLTGPRSIKPGSVGLPKLGTEVKIVDAQGHDVLPGNTGEFVIRAQSLPLGYYKDDEATRKTWRDGWFYTGDTGVMDEEGTFLFSDRKGDMLKVKGENVSASEVETVLNNHPAIEEAAVVPVPTKSIWGEKILAFVKLVEGEEVSEINIIDFCSDKLASFKVPHFIQRIEEFHKTSTGKIVKTDLKKIGKDMGDF